MTDTSPESNQNNSQDLKNPSTVIRVVHNRENPYVQLNKEALWNEKLSLKAIGLWARCMSRKDTWSFNVAELASKCKEGRRAIDSAIHELIDEGYAMRLDYYQKASDGKFSNKGFAYVFFEFAATDEEMDAVIEDFKKRFRDCCFGNLRRGDLRNVELVNNDLEEKIDLKKKQQQQTPITPLPEAPPQCSVFQEDCSSSCSVDDVVFSSNDDLFCSSEQVESDEATEDQKKEALLLSYDVSLILIDALLPYTFEQIRDGIECMEEAQAKKPLANPHGFLRKAIESGWRPNSKNKKATGKKYTAEEVKSKLEAQMENWSQYFTDTFKIIVHNSHCMLKCTKGCSPLCYDDPEFMGKINAFMKGNMQTCSK